MTELTRNIVQAGEGISEVSENVANSFVVSQQISADISEVNSAVSEISTGTVISVKILKNCGYFHNL